MLWFKLWPSRCQVWKVCILVAHNHWMYASFYSSWIALGLKFDLIKHLTFFKTFKPDVIEIENGQVAWRQDLHHYPFTAPGSFVIHAWKEIALFCSSWWSHNNTTSQWIELWTDSRHCCWYSASFWDGCHCIGGAQAGEKLAFEEKRTKVCYVIT